MSPVVGAAGASVDRHAEWLEADGLGGFASGTASGVRTRRYHALLLTAAKPPGDRRALVQGFGAWLETTEGSLEIWPQAYQGGFLTGTDVESVDFACDPWPSWWVKTRLGTVCFEIFVPRGMPVTVLAARGDGVPPGTRLTLRPFLSGRDF